MSDSLGDLLSDKAKRYTQPSEIEIIKNFVKAKFDTDISVLVKPTQIVIGTPSAALASSLRFHLHEIEQLVGSNRHLIIRIGQ